MARVLGNVVALRRTPESGGWLTAPAPRSAESARDRVGKHVSTTIDGVGASLGLRVTDPNRLLSVEQLLLVYMRTPDVRASIDGIARRISTWAWTIEVEMDLDDPEYDEALERATEADRFLRAPNNDGETWQEVITKLVTDLLIYEQGAIEEVYDCLVKVPVPGAKDGTTMGVPSPKATLEELVVLNGASIVPQTDEFGRVLGYAQDVFGTIGPLSNGGRMGDEGATAPRFSREQLVVFRLFPNTTGRTAPLIETLVNEVVTILRSSEHTMLAMDADEIPPGILVLTGVAGKAAEQAKADLQRLRGRDHKIRVITNPDPRGSGAQWVELRRTPKDLQLLDVMAEVRRTIWRVFGVMPVEMGATDGLPRASAQVQLDVGSSHLVEPILDQLEAKLNARVLPLLVGEDFAGRLLLRFDREAKLSPQEQQAKASALVSLVREGIITRNEARADLDQAPIDGGDEATISTTTGLTKVASLAPAEAVAAALPVAPLEVVPEEPAPGEVTAGPDEAQPFTVGRLTRLATERATVPRDDLPSDWPSASLFKGYRTLALNPLAQVVAEYTRTVEPFYNEAMDETLAIVAREYDGSMRPEEAQRALHAIDASLSKLEDRWSVATLPLYERGSKIARDSATHHAGVPVLDDYAVRGRAYGERAMHYLTAPEGLVTELRTQVAAVIGRATGEPSRSKVDEVEVRGILSKIVPGVDEGTLLEAVAAVFTANRARIENWAGRLVEMANEVFKQGMFEGIGSQPAGPTSAEEWYVEWVAVGDEAMCTTCTREGAVGFRPASALHSVPGGTTECRARCRCVLVWWTRSEVASGAAISLSGNAPGNRPL